MTYNPTDEEVKAFGCAAQFVVALVTVLLASCIISIGVWLIWLPN